MQWLIIIGVVVAVLAFYVLSTYNHLVTVKTRIKAAIQEIGNQLKRQADLIPNLEESAKAYLKHEKGIFEELAAARKAVDDAVSSGDLGQASKASDLINRALSGLRVVVESNPEIKGSEVVTNLMNELRDTADKVMYSRRTLIDLTADYNIMVQTFPSNLVASMFGFQQEAGLVMPEESVADATTVTVDDTKTPKVKLS